MTMTLIQESFWILRKGEMYGTNTFYWSRPREDINWYRDDQVVCLMRAPQPVNRRSVRLDIKVWDLAEKVMG